MKPTYLCVFASCLLFGFFELWAAPPTWRVRVADYQYSMTVTALLKVNAAYSTESNDIAAAVVGNEVRGVGNPQIWVSGTGQRMVFLQVYSNQVYGETIQFKIYDASADQILTAVSAVLFHSNQTIGSIASPFLITDNYGPETVLLSSQSIDENAPVGTAVGNLASQDQDGGTFTFDLVSGEGDTHNALFEISGNRLLSKMRFDYETKNSYAIRLRATDDGNEYTEKAFTIAVLDINDAPTKVNLSANTVPEHASLGTTIGTLSATDVDANPSNYTYTLVTISGEVAPNNTLFLIDGSTLKTNSLFNYEVKANYRIHVRATDTDGLYREEVIALRIGDENDAPTAIHLSKSSISEQSVPNSDVLTLSASDVDAGDAHTYALLNEQVPFSVRDNQLVLLSALNYERQNLYVLTLRVTDAAGSVFSQTLTLRVSDANDTPSNVWLSRTSLEENEPIKSLFARLSTTDEDQGDRFTYQLVSGEGDDDNSSFYIGHDSLRTSAVFNYEVKNVYKVRLRTTDAAGAHFTKAYTLNIINVSDVITNLTLGNTSLAENSLPGTTIGSFGVADEDTEEQHTLALVAGVGSDDNANFVIQGKVLKNLRRLDYETQSTHRLRVRATDLAGNSYEKAFTVTLIDENELANTLNLTNTSVNENAAVGTVVGTLSTADPDAGDTFTYALEDAADTHRFRIQGTQLLTNEKLNYEAQIFHTIKVSSTDQGNNKRIQSFVINAVDVNEAPTDLALSNTVLNENTALDTPIGILTATDVDAAAPFTFVLANVSSSGYDQADFVVKQNTLRNAVAFNYETKSTYKVRLKVIDNGGLSFEKDVNIRVGNVNESPAQITISNASVLENQGVETWVGRFGTTDPDGDTQFQYRLVSGDGDTNNAGFFIRNDQLYTAAVFDHETKSAYSVRVRSTDAGGLYYEKKIIVAITDANDPPTDILLSASQVPENTSLGYVIGYLSVEDPDDAVDNMSYQVAESSGAGYFKINGTELVSNEVLDYETQRIYVLKVVATDASGHRISRLFTLQVTDKDDLPTGIALTQKTLYENQPRATQAATLAIIDVDTPTETYAYALVTGEGSDDNALFYLADHRVYLAQPLNYEQKKEYKIRVRAMHSNGTQYGLTHASFVIQAKDVNDPPSGVRLTETKIEENKKVGTLIGTISAVDEDVQDAFVYTLHGSPDVLSLFNISQGQLYSLAVFDYERQGRYDIQIRATDKGGEQVTMPVIIEVINVNDPPIFSAQSLSVDENSPAGTAVGKVEAVDADKNHITYAFVSLTGAPNANHHFSIDPASGMVRVQNPLVLDYEKTKTLKIEVSATDNGSPAAQSRGEYTIAIKDVAEPKLPAAMAMSPNGDGINDYWTIENVALYADMELVIFDARGHILYQKVGYENNWNGYYKNQPLPQGVYYYVLRHMNGSVAYRGSISVLR